MRSFVVFVTAVSYVMAMQSKPSIQDAVSPRESGNVEDIMNVVILDASTPDEKEIIVASVKVMIDDITKLAKSAVAVLNRNKVLLSKAVNLIETAKDMLGEDEDLGAVELMQTILLAKIQDMVMMQDLNMEKTYSNKKAELDSSGDTDLELPDDNLIKKNTSPKNM